MAVPTPPLCLCCARSQACAVDETFAPSPPSPSADTKGASKAQSNAPARKDPALSTGTEAAGVHFARGVSHGEASSAEPPEKSASAVSARPRSSSQQHPALCTALESLQMAGLTCAAHVSWCEPQQLVHDVHDLRWVGQGESDKPLLAHSAPAGRRARRAAREVGPPPLLLAPHPPTLPVDAREAQGGLRLAPAARRRQPVRQRDRSPAELAPPQPNPPNGPTECAPAGSQGVVYEGIWQGAVVAVKWSIVEVLDAGAYELLFSKLLGHPNVVQTYSAKVAILDHKVRAVHERRHTRRAWHSAGGALPSRTPSPLRGGCRSLSTTCRATSGTARCCSAATRPTRLTPCSGERRRPNHARSTNETVAERSPDAAAMQCRAGAEHVAMLCVLPSCAHACRRGDSFRSDEGFGSPVSRASSFADVRDMLRLIGAKPGQSITQMIMVSRSTYRRAASCRCCLQPELSKRPLISFTCACPPARVLTLPAGVLRPGQPAHGNLPRHLLAQQPLWRQGGAARPVPHGARGGAGHDAPAPGQRRARRCARAHPCKAALTPPACP